MSKVLGALVLVGAVVTAPGLLGCVMSSPTRPMRVLDATSEGPARADGLVVFLPGFGDHAGHFERHGLLRTVEEETGYDAIAANAHFGYYRVYNLVERLEEDVIAPARRAGYREIWLVGVSMGGYGALSYAERHPEDVDGIILLAPYLGESEVVESVKGAASVAGWEPPEDSGDVRVDQSRNVWAWLRGRVRERDVPIYIGYGEADPSAEDHALLGGALPEGHAFPRGGGHNWYAWKPIFAEVAAVALAR